MKSPMINLKNLRSWFPAEYRLYALRLFLILIIVIADSWGMRSEFQESKLIISGSNNALASISTDLQYIKQKSDRLESQLDKRGTEIGDLQDWIVDLSTPEQKHRAVMEQRLRKIEASLSRNGLK